MESLDVLVWSFVVGGALGGAVLGSLFRWKLLLLITTTLVVAFIAFSLHRADGGSHESFYAMLAGSIIFSLGFLAVAWLTRLICFAAGRRKKLQNRLT